MELGGRSHGKEKETEYRDHFRNYLPKASPSTLLIALMARFVEYVKLEQPMVGELHGLTSCTSRISSMRNLHLVDESGIFDQFDRKVHWR